MTDWALYRTFLEVLRTGSQSQAAIRLGIAQPTVRRQIETLERSLGQTLFLRSQTGLAPTDLALSLRAYAEAIEAQAAAIERRAACGADLDGTVRISASRMVAAEVLPGMLTSLRAQQPALRFEFDDSNDQRDLMHRVADIAIRMVRPTQLDLIQTHVGDVSIGFYAHASWVDRNGHPEDKSDLVRSGALLGYDRDAFLEKQWTLQLPGLGAGSFALRCDNEPILFSALRAGMGIGACHVPIARRYPELVRIVPSWTARLGVWVVTHPDLRHDRSVGYVYRYLCDNFSVYVAS